MPLTQPATAPASPDNAPTGVPTSEITNSYDANGHQVVEDDVFGTEGEVGFDAPTDQVVDDQPADQVDDTQRDDQPDDQPENQPQDQNQPAKPVEPVNTSGLNLYKDKYKTVQDLKNAFIELGGDPARYGDNVQLLEEAYAVRQREFSQSRAQISQTAQPAVPLKTFQEILNEEFSKYDPATFTTPQEMWAAQTKATQDAAARFEQQQSQAAQQNQITPQEMDRQIKIVNNLHEIETKVPRLKTDKQFREAFAMHIRVMRDEGRMPVKQDGTNDLIAAMKDFIGGQRAVVEEAQKAFAAQQDGKDLSTATGGDNSPANPAGPARRNSGDSLVDDLINYHNDYQRKYS